MKYLTQNKKWSINKQYNISVMLYLLIDRPSRITGIPQSLIWKNNKEGWHRDYSLPAVASIDFVQWYIDEYSAGTIYNFD